MACDIEVRLDKYYDTSLDSTVTLSVIDWNNSPAGFTVTIVNWGASSSPYYGSPGVPLGAYNHTYTSASDSSYFNNNTRSVSIYVQVKDNSTSALTDYYKYFTYAQDSTPATNPISYGTGYHNNYCYAGPVDAGPDEHCCYGSSPFNLSGGSPKGGTWSGDGIIDENNGTFDPSLWVGDNYVEYSYGPFSDTKIVTVYDIPWVYLWDDPPDGDGLSYKTIYSGSSIQLCPMYPEAGWIYDWSTGESTECITVSPTTTTSYTLTVTDANGCVSSVTEGSPYTEIAVVVRHIPAISGPDSACDSLDLSSSTYPNTTYQWYKDGNAIPGETSSILSVTESGNYYIEITESHTTPTGVIQTSDVSPSRDITIYSKPIISANVQSDGQVLLSLDSGDYPEYQWKLDGNDIQGTTTDSILAFESGVYVLTIPSLSGTNCYESNAIDVHVAGINNLPLCQGSMQFSTEKQSYIPAGRYSVEYETGLDIKIDNTADWLYLGSDTHTLMYDTSLHLGIGENIYDAGYVYDSHFPANGVLMEARLSDRQALNNSRNDKRGISPRRVCDKKIEFSDDDMRSLMVMHYDNCIDNSAGFYALYDKLFLVEGQFNEAAAFTSSPLIIGNTQYVNINEGTIMMWVKRLCYETGKKYYILDMKPFHSTDLIKPTFSLYIDEFGRLTFEIVGYSVVKGTGFVNKETYAVRYPVTSSDLNDKSRFNHITISWKNNSPNPSDNFMRLYINGNKRSTLKYDMGAKFGITELTEEEKLMGDYISHAVVGQEYCTGGSGPYCYIGTPTPIPQGFTLAADNLVLYDGDVCGYSGNTGWTVNGYVGKYVILKNDPNDPSRDQVRKIVQNTECALIVDKPWDSGNLPSTDSMASYIICGHAYYISDKLDKFMRNKLQMYSLPANIAGLRSYYSRYVENYVSNMKNAPQSFDDWVDMLNNGPSYTYDSCPTDLSEIGIAGLELKSLSIANANNLYDFPYIYIGSDNAGLNIGNVALDQLAFYTKVLDDDEISVYNAPVEINLEDNAVALGYNFDASSSLTTSFTSLQDEVGRSFETYINVLNPFSLPIDKSLLTDLLNMIKPAQSSFFINHK